MLVLSKSEINEIFSMRDAIEACKKALVEYTNKNSNVPLRTNLEVDKYNGQSLFMPASVNGDIDALGIKVVSVYPDNIKKGLDSVPSTMIVMDSETGIVSAILEGTFLTQLRTAAVQGAATDLLSRRDSKIATIIGTGGQALQQCRAMLSVRDIDTLNIFDIDENRARDFVDKLEEEFSNEFNTKFVACNDVSKAVKDSDIITSVTTSKVPTFNGNDIKEGAHINGIGSYTPEMIELPKEIFNKASCIVFDTYDGVINEAGDVINALNTNSITKENITGELGQLILKDIEGRKNDTDITIFKTVGSAVLDVVTAHLIVEEAKKNNIGTSIDLK